MSQARNDRENVALVGNDHKPLVPVICQNYMTGANFCWSILHFTWNVICVPGKLKIDLQ